MGSGQFNYSLLWDELCSRAAPKKFPNNSMSRIVSNFRNSSFQLKRSEKISYIIGKSSSSIEKGLFVLLSSRSNKESRHLSRARQDGVFFNENREDAHSIFVRVTSAVERCSEGVGILQSRSEHSRPRLYG